MVEIISLREAHQKFIEYLGAQKRASATILAYGKDIDQLVSFLGTQEKKTVEVVAQKDLEDFLAKLQKEGYTPKSVSRKINSLKTFYRFLKTQGVTEDPSSLIAHPKYEVKPPRILSRLEYRALRDTCRHDIRIAAIVELLLQTGMRIGELANLEVSDIKNGEIYIKPYESHEARTVPLNRAAKQSLQAYVSIRPKTGNKTLFVTKTGRPLLIRNIRTAIDRYFRLAGIKEAKVNDLRHTFVAHHLAAGTPLTTISKLVGHKRLSTTEKYLEFVKDRLEESVKLEEL